MTLKNLKNKISRNVPEIIGVTVAVATVTTAVVVVVKTLKDGNIATTIRDTIVGNGGNIDLSSVDEINKIYDIIGEATEASISFITNNDAIIFLSK